MKKILFTAVVSILGSVLIACSTNTQSENTAIGAVTGAAIGGLAGSAIGQGTGQAVAIGTGIVGGGLVGGAIGHSMDSSDNSSIYRTLDYNSINKPSSWTNKRTLKTYTFVPTSDFIKVKGNPHCRRYRATAVVNNTKRHLYGTACHQPNGTWSPA